VDTACSKEDCVEDACDDVDDKEPIATPPRSHCSRQEPEDANATAATSVFRLSDRVPTDSSTKAAPAGMDGVRDGGGWAPVSSGGFRGLRGLWSGGGSEFFWRVFGGVFGGGHLSAVAGFGTSGGGVGSGGGSEFFWRVFGGGLRGLWCGAVADTSYGLVWCCCCCCCPPVDDGD